MELEYYKLNPTGNISLIVTSTVPREAQAELAGKLMELDSEAEQVGFIEKPQDKTAACRLQMMGGEFCGNASISVAALFAGSSGLDSGTVNIEVSGSHDTLGIKIIKTGEKSYLGTVEMPSPEGVEDILFRNMTLPVVRFPGICHIITDEGSQAVFGKAELRELCVALRTEAVGVMFTDGKSLRPYVYVASTDSAVWESSCASGTTAVAAYFAISRSSAGREYSFDEPGGRLTVSVDPDTVPLGLTLCGEVKIVGKHLISI